MRRHRSPSPQSAGGRASPAPFSTATPKPEPRWPTPPRPAASGKPGDRAAQDTGQEATWRERALNAEDALKAARAEIVQQRTRIGELLGQVRDLEAEWTKESIQRITTENTTLKQRVRQLTTDNRTLDERLTAARSNLRFQDRRLAGLEAQILDQPAQIAKPDLDR